MPEKKTRVIQILIITFLAIVVYFNSLFGGFVYDDEGQVVNNPWIRDWSHLGDTFLTGVWDFQAIASNYYRPLMHIMYTVAYHVFGLSPWGFHLVNVLFHTGNSILVFSLAERLFRTLHSNRFSSPLLGNNSPIPSSEKAMLLKRGLEKTLSPSFVTAILFAVHPIHTEAVAWVAGLPELSFTFFVLLSFYFYLRWRECVRTGVLGLSLLSFFLATLCKETALIFPVLLLAYDVISRRALPGTSVFGQLKGCLPYLAVAGVYLTLRVQALGGFAPVRETYQSAISPGSELNAYHYFINIFPFFAQYLEKLLVPVGLNVWHVFHPITSLLTAKGLLSIFVALLYLGILVIAAKKNRIVLFALLLIIVPLTPAFYIPGIASHPFSERYLYLPSVGFVMLIASFLLWAKSRRPELTGIFAALFLGLTVLYSIGTINRNRAWKDDFTLWTDTLTKSPDAAEPHYNLAHLLEIRGELEESIAHYQMAISLSTNPKVSSAAHNNLGYVYRRLGMVDLAIEHFRISIMLVPGRATAHNNIASAYAEAGMREKAVEHLQMAIRLKPDLADAHYNLGIIYRGMVGREDMAIEHLETAVRFRPADEQFRDELDRAYEERSKRMSQR